LPSQISGQPLIYDEGEDEEFGVVDTDAAAVHSVALNFSADPTATPAGHMDFQREKEDFEKTFIIRALKANSGRINMTARNVNIPKKTLLRKIEKYAINPREYGKNPPKPATAGASNGTAAAPAATSAPQA
jgi:DNA-binding NtrC family response regulator